MNPSSLGIDTSAVQRQKDMNRNRPGDELGETNKLFGSYLFGAFDRKSMEEMRAYEK